MESERDDDVSVVQQAVAGAADLAFSGAYIGVSYRDLARYKRWENPAEGLVLDEDDAEITHLYAALSVLVRAAMTEPAATPGSKWITAAGEAVREAERRFYPATAFPYDASGFPDEDARNALPTAQQLAAVSMRERFRLLEADSIRHEWTVKAGKRLFNQLTVRLDAGVRRVICNDKGALGLGNHGDLLQASASVAAFIVGEYGFDQNLIGVAASMAVIMVRRGLEQFCAAQSS